VLGHYLRGQLRVIAALASYYTLALLLAGFDLALPLGVLSGVSLLIPYLGFGVACALALLAGALQFSGTYGVVAALVIYGGGQVLEGFVLTPYWVGERIGLHPLAVIFLLLAFGHLFGFVGVLIALPAGAMLLVSLRRLRELYQRSSLYRG
jgi:predicted PurR-regulated permease PerM